MRGDLDVVEDIRVKKDNKIINKNFTSLIIYFLFFLIFCGLLFNGIYLLSREKVKKLDQKMEDLSKDKRDNTRKTYYIEQKIREDLEKINKN